MRRYMRWAKVWHLCRYGRVAECGAEAAGRHKIEWRREQPPKTEACSRCFDV